MIDDYCDHAGDDDDDDGHGEHASDDANADDVNAVCSVIPGFAFPGRLGCQREHVNQPTERPCKNCDSTEAMRA